MSGSVVTDVEPDLLETVDVHRFIMGDDWPMKELLRRGFTQDTKSEYYYLRQLPSCGLTVDMYTYAMIEGVPNAAMIDASFDDGTKTWVLWSAVIPFKLMGPSLDKILAILEPLPAGYFLDSAKQTEVYTKLEALVKKSSFGEAMDPKDYIMSDAWVTDDLRQLGFKPLNPNDSKYFVKRFYAPRSKSWAAIVIWFEKSAAHMTVERLVDKHYQELWSSYVKLPYVARMAEVVIKAFRSFRNFPPREAKMNMSMIVSAYGNEALGQEYSRVFGTQDDIGNTFYNVTHKEEPPVEEAVDAKQFIKAESPLFEFKVKLLELGWEFKGEEKTPTIHGGEVPVQHFIAIHEPSLFSGYAGLAHLDCYVSETVVEEKLVLSAYGGGSRTDMTGEETDWGAQKTEDKEWDTEEFIQPDKMTPSEFAEWVDDEIRASGPKEE